MVGQVSRNRVGRREGKGGKQPGGNHLPFVGQVLGHGKTYKEGGGDTGRDGKISPRTLTGYTCTR